MVKTNEEITNCRLCNSKKLKKFLTFGDLRFSGIFPKSNEKVPVGEISLVLCVKCKLIQTDRNFNREIMYGDNYGYRSGLNSSMVNHLDTKAQELIDRYHVSRGDVVIDIGSNDGTFLNAFDESTTRIGFDPTIKKFGLNYKQGIIKVADFFDLTSSELNFEKSAKLITSISMFYDLPDPKNFVETIAKTLDPKNGVWHFEQAYWPETLRTLGYDTICHEHLEYYSLTSVFFLLEQTNMKIIDLTFNSVNGGSFAITASLKTASYKSISKEIILWHLENEKQSLKFKTLKEFGQECKKHSRELKNLLILLNKNGKSIAALGASTKGNILLQTSNINPTLIEAIGEVNIDKIGCFTPGSNIPIVGEEEILQGSYDYILILPWHFKEGIIKKIKKSNSHVKIIIPLPTIQIV